MQHRAERLVLEKCRRHRRYERQVCRVVVDGHAYRCVYEPKVDAIVFQDVVPIHDHRQGYYLVAVRDPPPERLEWKRGTLVTPGALKLRVDHESPKTMELTSDNPKTHPLITAMKSRDRDTLNSTAEWWAGQMTDDYEKGLFVSTAAPTRTTYPKPAVVAGMDVEYQLVIGHALREGGADCIITVRWKRVSTDGMQKKTVSALRKFANGPLGRGLGVEPNIAKKGDIIKAFEGARNEGTFEYRKLQYKHVHGRVVSCRPFTNIRFVVDGFVLHTSVPTEINVNVCDGAPAVSLDIRNWGKPFETPLRHPDGSEYMWPDAVQGALAVVGSN